MSTQPKKEGGSLKNEDLRLFISRSGVSHDEIGEHLPNKSKKADSPQIGVNASAIRKRLAARELTAAEVKEFKAAIKAAIKAKK